MASFLHLLCHRLNRTKAFASADPMETQLKRCLSTFDITLLAVGHMVGSGIYVLTSTVSRDLSGPGIVVSFMISGLASLLAALCYAELGVRYPRSGSSYSYTYLALGEFLAFLVGWNVILEQVIGIAAVSRACSAYIDSLLGGIIKNSTDNLIGTNHSSLLAEHFDILAPIILMVVVVFLSFGAKMTSYINNVFSIINMSIIVVIIGMGAYYADINNWTNPDTGGFLPYGWKGVFAGSASCFYAFVGFDSIASSGEEARNPQKSIPVATFLSMGIATVAYVAVSSVLTLMVSYKDITSDAGLPDAFAMHGATWVKIVVIIGALCGMATGLIGGIFGLTRVVYCMADDGLIFAIFSKLFQRTQIPVIAMYAFSLLAGILAMTFDISSLVEVLSIGTLLAYLVVSASVIVLRYQPPTAASITDNNQEMCTMGGVGTPASDEKMSLTEDMSGQLKDRYYFLSRFICFGLEPGLLVNLCVVLMVAVLLVFGGMLQVLQEELLNREWWSIFVITLLSLAALMLFLTIGMHQQNTSSLQYKVPCVPFIPIFSIFCNALLMTNLKPITWLRLLIWITVGLLLYFFYGITHSKLNLTIIPTSNSSLLAPGTTVPAYSTGPSTESSYGTPATSARQSIDKQPLIDSEEEIARD